MIDDANTLPNLLNVPCMIVRSLLTISGSRSTEGLQPHPLEEDYAYLASLFRPILDK